MSAQLQPTVAGPASRVYPPQRTTCQRMLKRTIDVFGAMLLLLLLSPLMVFIGLLIFLTEGVPVIYRRRVLGIQGDFDAYKFRTMCRNADNILQANVELRQAFSQNFKLQSDPRVTRLGAWLRKFSLDELPQLVNVLLGQMSLVGPRMITAGELSRYGDYQDLLLSVQPGLTGYWQIRGRQDVSYEERVLMDVQYITQWTLGLDVGILLKTPWTVVKGRGAY
jgi:lipopolysaccharide/colanic/teichoic acid biosynthesis glycosyltransferase